LARERDRLFAARYLLSPAVRAESFTVEGLRARFAELEQALQSAAAPLILASAARDPSGEFTAVLAQFADRPQPLRRHGVWSSADGRTALVLAQTAANGFSKLDMPYEQAKAIVFAGVALTQKRQFGDALAAFRDAQAMLEHDGNAFWSALLDLYRAEVMFCIGRLWEAHSLASTADAKFTELGDTAKRLVSLVLLGRVAMQLGRESISSSVTALMELVKNAYDADAGLVTLTGPGGGGKTRLAAPSARTIIADREKDGATPCLLCGCLL